MIQSMTGFGAAEKDIFRVELRSVNHRFLDISIRFPAYLSEHEIPLRNMLKERFSRGKFDVTVSAIDGGRVRVRVNRDIVKELYSALGSLKQEMSLPGDIGIEAIAGFRDLFLSEDVEYDAASLYDAFNEAMGRLHGMRLREGEAVSKDIFARLKLLEQMKEEISLIFPGILEASRSRLTERLNALFGEAPFDENRVLQEAAIISERADISEEVTRIGSHLAQMRKFFSDSDTIGRKAEFILQEINREVNTIASKANHQKISGIIIEMKSEIEKLREQVQNIQ